MRPPACTGRRARFQNNFSCRAEDVFLCSLRHALGVTPSRLQKFRVKLFCESYPKQAEISTMGISVSAKRDKEQLTRLSVRYFSSGFPIYFLNSRHKCSGL